MDEAVQNSLATFRMPSYFTDGDVLGAHLQGQRRKHVYKKIPNLQQQFEQRNYKLALFTVLQGYYKTYREQGLKPLNSEYCLNALYREEHLSIADLFDLCSSLTSARG